MADRRLFFEAAHGRGVEATVHVHDFTADAGRQVRAQEGAGVADFFDGDVAAQRSLRFVGGQHLAEVLDAGSGEGADRASRYAVDASTVRAQGTGQVTYASFQGRLGHAHYVVVRHGALCTQVRQGQQAAVAAFHHFATGLGQGHEAVGADVVSDAE